MGDKDRLSAVEVQINELRDLQKFVKFAVSQARQAESKARQALNIAREVTSTVDTIECDLGNRIARLCATAQGGEEEDGSECKPE